MAYGSVNTSGASSVEAAAALAQARRAAELAAAAQAAAAEAAERAAEILGTVENISANAIPASEKGAANGVATLNANRKLVQMPTAADVGALPSTTQVVPPTRKVAGKALSADVNLTKADVGLGSVDNTADSAKSVKYAASAGSTTGNAGSATKLATARTIGISGGATGTATSFNGSANITIPVTALDVSKATAGTLPVARGGTGQTSLNNVTVGKANACNGLTFAVASAAPTAVTNNKVTFVYG